MPTLPPLESPVDFVQGAVASAMKEAGASAGKLWLVPRDQIVVVEGLNVRIMDTKDYAQGIAELKNSMLTNGFYQDKPLTGFVAKDDGDGNTIFLTDGHRRLAAYDMAVKEGLDTIELPVIVKPQGTSMEDVLIAMTKTGTPLTPLEWGVVCKRLIAMGLPAEDVAKRLNITKRYVDDLLLLVSAPAKVRNMVVSGKVSATLAIAELRKAGADAPAVLEAAVVEAETSGRKKATKKHVARAEGKGAVKKDAKKAGAKKADAKADARKTKRQQRAEAAAGTGPVNADYELAAKAGEERTVAEIKIFEGIAGGIWYEMAEKEGVVRINRDTKIKITVRCKAAPSLAEEAAGL